MNSTEGQQAARERKKSRWLLFLAAGILTLILAGASFFFDDPIRNWILQQQGESWRKSAEAKFWGAVSKYGDWPQLFGVGCILMLIALRTGHQRIASVLAAAVLASTVSGIIANTSRLTTGRVRPRDEAKLGAGFFGPWHEGLITVGIPGYNSFPSGHAATAFGFAAPLLFAAPVFGVGLMIGGGLVAWSRMALGAHHFSDIVVSFLLSLWVGYFCLRWVERNWLDVFVFFRKFKGRWKRQ